MDTQITIQLLAFGIARDVLGQRQTDWVLPAPATVDDLRADLEKHFPLLTGLASLAIAINSEYARKGQALADGDEVALIPPVSGG